MRGAAAICADRILSVAETAGSRRQDVRHGQARGYGRRENHKAEREPNSARGSERADSGEDGCVNKPECGGEEEGDAEEAPGGQAEVSIAVDESGQHIVIGFNDTRGFSENPISVSGVLYSEDGGRTFVDGGRLPSPGNEVIGTTRFPQVFGDPEVKYLGHCVFVYSSILIKKFSDTTARADDGRASLDRLRQDLARAVRGDVRDEPERHRRRG